MNRRDRTVFALLLLAWLASAISLQALSTLSTLCFAVGLCRLAEPDDDYRPAAREIPDRETQLRLAAQGPYTGYPNPNWARQYIVDYTGALGTPSDGNDCLTNATPCATANEIVWHRWGCNGSDNCCPVWTTTSGQPSPSITFNSGAPNFSDAFAIHGCMIPQQASDAATQSAPTVVIQGTPVCTTGNSVTVTSQQNRTANTAFVASLTFVTDAGAANAEYLLEDTNRANSIAWVTNQSNRMTRPAQPTTLSTNGSPSLNPAALSSNHWLTGDSITSCVLPQVNLIEASVNEGGLNGYGVLDLYRIRLVENRGFGVQPGDDPFVAGDNVQFIESVSERRYIRTGSSPSYLEGAGTSLGAGVINSQLLGGYVGGTLVPNNGGITSSQGIATIAYGEVSNHTAFGTGTGGLSFNGTLLAEDVYVASQTSGCTFSGASAIEFAELETTCVGRGGGEMQINGQGGNGVAQSILWGVTGILDTGDATVLYTPGAGEAAATFPLASGVQICGGTTATLNVGSSSTPGSTFSVANADSNLGSSTGDYTGHCGGRFSNSSL
jgi:hypothetical protein